MLDAITLVDVWSCGRRDTIGLRVAYWPLSYYVAELWRHNSRGERIILGGGFGSTTTEALEQAALHARENTSALQKHRQARKRACKAALQFCLVFHRSAISETA